MGKAQARTSPARHHGALVVLHWAMAALIIGNYVGGRFILQEEPNAASAAPALAAHILAGLSIAALLLPRFILRFFVRKPEPVGSGPLKIAASATHWGFYLILFAVVMSGVGLAALSGALPALFEGAPLPATFKDYPPQKGHALFANVLLGLVVLHTGAALYHHFIRRDGLLSRMGFGPRERAASATPGAEPGASV